MARRRRHATSRCHARSGRATSLLLGGLAGLGGAGRVKGDGDLAGRPLVRLAVIVATVELVMVLVVFLMPLPVMVTLPAPRPPTLTATLVLPTFLDSTFSGQPGVCRAMSVSAVLPFWPSICWPAIWVALADVGARDDEDAALAAGDVQREAAHRGVGDVGKGRHEPTVLDVAGPDEVEPEAVLAGHRDHELGQRPDLTARLGVDPDVLDEVHRTAQRP